MNGARYGSVVAEKQKQTNKKKQLHSQQIMVVQLLSF